MAGSQPRPTAQNNVACDAQQIVSNTQPSPRRANRTHQCSEDFNARAYSSHAVSGWTPSLPLRVLYRTLNSQLRRLIPKARVQCLKNETAHAVDSQTRAE